MHLHIITSYPSLWSLVNLLCHKPSEVDTNYSVNQNQTNLLLDFDGFGVLRISFVKRFKVLSVLSEIKYSCYKCSIQCDYHIFSNCHASHASHAAFNEF